MKTMLKQTLIVLLGILMTQPVLAQDWLDEYLNDGSSAADEVEYEEEEEYTDVTGGVGYYIDNYKVRVDVGKNNENIIEETIDVVFTERSHGIYRMIPTWVWVDRDFSKNQDGSDVRPMHYKIDITMLHSSDPWSLMDDYSELYAVRFGKYDTLFTGRHTYNIRYAYKIPGDRVPQADVLFYSVLGKGWDCKVNHFEFKMVLEKPLTSEEQKKVQVFTGEWGNDVDVADKVITMLNDTCICGAVDNIEAESAVTVYAPLREGYYEENGTPKDDILLTWALGILALLLAFYVLYTEIAKREHVTPIVSFYPPEGSSSAEVGTLIDTSVDDRDLISMIPWFAQQGYLTIDNTGDHPVLQKLKPLDSKAPNFAKTLFDGFFPGEKTTFDTGNVDNSFGSAWLNSQSEATAFYRNKLNTIKFKHLFMLIVAIALAGIANGCASNSTTALTFGFSTALIYLVTAIVRLGATDDKSHGSRFLSYVVAVLCGIVAYGCFYGNAVDGYDLLLVDIKPLIAINAVVFLACIFSNRLTIMTKYRRERIGVILGLHDFIDTAEKAQLQQLQAEDEKYFYNVLPYAVAFGMVDHWAEKFKGIKVAPVDWYRAGDMSTMNAFTHLNTNRMLTPSIRNAISNEQRAREAAAAARSASHSRSGGGFSGGGGGFSGGGFSGGGFGGGGGGRW